MSQDFTSFFLSITSNTTLSVLLSGLIFTIALFFVTLIGSLPLGVLIAFGRMSKHKIISYPVRFYISVMRGTPLMLQLMAIMYGPYFIWKFELGGNWMYVACAIGFIINYAAYFAEIYRSGIQSIPKGQYEAAEVLGYTKSQTFMKIILPQVIKRILPSMGNEIITLVKDTSLAFVLSIPEMFSAARARGAAEASLIPYAIAGFVYWIINWLIEMILNRMEKKMDYYHD